MTPAFEAYPKTPRLSKLFWCVITEKIDGSNASILVENGEVVAVGSRTRLITPGNMTDNFGFAAWVEQNKEELGKLGEGRHFGEWYGSGIQCTYGLTEKRFALFDTDRYHAYKPDCVELVPVLYRGEYSKEAVDNCMRDLATAGSRAVPGWMKPEGIIVNMRGERAKHTFEHVQGKWAA